MKNWQKASKKKFADAQIAEKKFPTTVTQTEDFFLALTSCNDVT